MQPTRSSADVSDGGGSQAYAASDSEASQASLATGSDSSPLWGSAAEGCPGPGSAYQNPERLSDGYAAGGEEDPGGDSAADFDCGADSLWD